MKLPFDKVYQDEINTWLWDFVDEIANNVELTEYQQDMLFDFLQPQLEKFFNYPDFRNYN